MDEAAFFRALVEQAFRDFGVMPMATYNANLRGPSARTQQRERYDHLAHWMWRVTTNNGKRAGPPEANIRRQLAASHAIDRNGAARPERISRFMRRVLGFRGNLPGDQAAWDDIVEGIS